MEQWDLALGQSSQPLEACGQGPTGPVLPRPPPTAPRGAQPSVGSPGLPAARSTRAGVSGRQCGTHCAQVGEGALCEKLTQQLLGHLHLGLLQRLQDQHGQVRRAVLLPGVNTDEAPHQNDGSVSKRHSKAIQTPSTGTVPPTFPAWARCPTDPHHGPGIPLPPPCAPSRGHPRHTHCLPGRGGRRAGLPST